MYRIQPGQAAQRVEIMPGYSLPDHALDVAYALSLYKQSEPNSPIVRDIRSQALVGIRAPYHTEGRLPWLTDKAAKDLDERLLARWKETHDPSAEDALDAIEAMPKRKPRAVDRRVVPFFAPQYLVRGADLLFTRFPESQLWPADHVRAALAAWWGISDKYMQEMISIEGYAAEVARVDSDLASMIWGQEAVDADIKLVRTAEARENGRLDAQMRDRVINAVYDILESDFNLWKRRSMGEAELLYEERLELMSEHIGIDKEELAALLTPQALYQIGKEDAAVADWIGFDPSIVLTAEITPMSIGIFIGRAKHLRTKARLAGANIYEQTDMNYYELMASIGRGLHPYAATYASWHYRRNEVSRCGGLRAFIGQAPEPEFASSLRSYGGLGDGFDPNSIAHWAAVRWAQQQPEIAGACSGSSGKDQSHVEMAARLFKAASPKLKIGG